MSSNHCFHGFTIFVLCLLRYCTAQDNTNPCETYGKCGEYGACSQQDLPICSCLPGFYPRNILEWSSGNWSSGCLRRKALSNCYGIEQDRFVKVQRMRMTANSFQSIGPKAECRGRCLSDCSCEAYAFDGAAGCTIWRGALIDIQKLPSGSGSDLYVRVSNYGLDKMKGFKKIIVVLVVVVFVIISICVSLFRKYGIAKRIGKMRSVVHVEAGAFDSVDVSLQEALSQINLQELPFFTFEILANATDDFSEANKLGMGGFGPVYKGELVDGREIAVKRLSEASRQGMQEFTNEVVLVSKVQHRNLVKLLGCCLEKKEMMLIYEYLPNKSLDSFLFDSSQEILDWGKRFNIIEGICRGLLYLHRDSILKIIHRDLKSSNILLDNDWNPKISDFGLARVFEAKQDHIRTLRVVGTYGYIAPEYAVAGRFSEKSDVFSFGVLILEITTGRKMTSFHHLDGPLNLLGYVWELWNKDNIGACIDVRMSGLREQTEVVRCIHIGLLCVQELPVDRPSIPVVLSMLSSEIIELPKPKQPAFTQNASHPSSSQPSQKRSHSINYVSLTVVDGR